MIGKYSEPGQFYLQKSHIIYRFFKNGAKHLYLEEFLTLVVNNNVVRTFQ